VKSLLTVCFFISPEMQLAVNDIPANKKRQLSVFYLFTFRIVHMLAFEI
jgi:hypothetical protein